MDNALYITLSKQTASFRQLDVIANNIANANTVGFKSDNMLFDEYLVENGKSNRNDRHLAFTQDATTAQDMRNGNIRTTNRMLDMALSGDGFFVVQTPLGERYTRAGNFLRNQDGTIITQQGYPVLSADRQPITLDPEQTDLVVREDGMITVGTEQISQIAIVQFPNPLLLEKMGNSLFKSEAAATPATNYRVTQGMLEDSNVTPVLALTEMINLQRTVTTTNNLMNSLDDLVRNAIRTISKQG